MFLEFYHLQEQPFGMTPDPSYLYASRTHTAALTSLTNGLKENRGFLALIAEPGMGKTTLLYRLLDDLRDSSRTVLVSQTQQCTARDLVEYILEDLGVKTEGMSFVAMHGKLNEALFAEMLAGKKFVLVVDEAQNLEDSVLETVRMLSNFETHNTKLLQIILAGQPRLASLLSQPRLAQLRQRIAVLGHLEPLGAEETDLYIKHRLKAAGYSGNPLFEPSAANLIAQRSHGVPRNINNLCYHSLRLSSSRGLQTVSSDIVQEAATQLDVRLFGLERAVVIDSGARPVQPAASLHDSKRSSASVPPPVSRDQQTKPKLPITYNSGSQSVRSRWSSRRAGLATIVLSLISVGAIWSYAAPRLDKALIPLRNPIRADSSPSSADLSAAAPLSYDAAPQDTAAGQVLTVIAGPQQTIKDLSLRYAGRFDRDLSDEISRLNPDLKDLDHLEAGQLVRIPLPPGAMKKVNDTGDEATPSKAEPTGNLFGKILALVRDRK